MQQKVEWMSNRDGGLVTEGLLVIIEGRWPITICQISLLTKAKRDREEVAHRNIDAAHVFVITWKYFDQTDDNTNSYFCDEEGLDIDRLL